MEASSYTREVFFSTYGDQLENDLDRYFPDNVWTGTNIALVTVYCALFLIGVCCNGWVAFVIGHLLIDGVGENSKHKFGNFVSNAVNSTAPKPIQIYIFALCFCDLIVSCFLIFLILDLSYGRWIVPSSTLVCQLYLSSESLNKFWGPFLLVALSGYCYVRVCKNEGYVDGSTSTTNQTLDSGTKTWSILGFSIRKTLLQPRACLVVIGICLGLAFTLITPVYLYSDVSYLILYNLNDTVIVSVTPKCAFNPPETVLTAFTIYSFICGYLIPAGLFTYFYVRIMRKALYHAKLRTINQPRLSNGPPSGDLLGAQPRRPPKSYLGRVVKTTLGLIIFYFVCWTPYWIMSFYTYTIPDDEQYHTENSGVIISYLIHLLPYLNCTGYPIIYTVLNKTIKDSYRRMKLRKELKNSRLVTLARKQSENNQLLTPANFDQFESRGNSFLFSVTPEESVHGLTNHSRHNRLKGLNIWAK